MDDVQIIQLIDVLNDIADNLRRIAFEIENLKDNKEDRQDETV